MPYKNFGILHWPPIVLLIGIFCLLAWAKRNNTTEQKWKFIFTISLVPALAVILRIGIIAAEGKFILKEDLPFHLCRILALAMPFALYNKNKTWINILYYFIIVGTIQSLLTPELSYGPPHYGYFIYFILHTFLFCIPIYVLKALKIIPNFKDLIKAYFYGNIFMIFTLILNFILKSNYFYTRHKPLSASLLDAMGPWPWYIISVELLTFVLFILAWLPFRKQK